MRGVVAATVALALALSAAPILAAEGDVVDEAGVLDEESRLAIESVVEGYASFTGGRLVVVTRTVAAATSNGAEDEARRRVANIEGGRGILVLVDLEPGGCSGAAGIATTIDVSAGALTPAESAAVVGELEPWLARCQAGAGLGVALGRLLAFTVDEATVIDGQGGDGAPGAAVPPGPPFPDPEPGRTVYDFAGVFRAETEAQAEATIAAIEARTGAEVVVYSQVVDYGVTTEEAEAHAIALIDQWGVGRRGFDDGLAILFDLDPSLVHGQVQLYGAPGYRAAYLSNAERQAIFDEDLLPRLQAGDLDGALNAALEKVDAAATPEHAARLQTARQIDAAVGLVGAPIVFLMLVGWAAWSWLRYGRDPEYLDDPSIHIPAPPTDLTAASGALVFDGCSSRRALTTALLDLASRGLVSFREEKTGLLGLGKKKVGIETGALVRVDQDSEWLRAKAARRPLSDAEEFALRTLESMSSDGFVEPDEVPKFAEHVGEFDKKLERHVVAKGWFREPPAKATTRWALRATIVLVAGGGGIVLGLNLPSNGFLFLGGAGVAAAVVMYGLARLMPARTMPGAMVRAMLAAYRRTLEKTMERARSMGQVVEEARLEWLETPDQAVVWGVALGLQSQVEEVLERSVSDVRAGRAAAGTYVPAWYHSGGSSGGGDGPGGASGSGGLLSSSPIPNVGGMMTALGTIGSSPSSGGSGFGGGSSGGGGGGSGGGF